MSSLSSIARWLPPIRKLYEHRNLLREQNRDLSERLHSAENRPETPQSVFFHYSANFDPIEIMKRHEVVGLRPSNGFLTNFLGVKIDPKFFPGILNERAGQVEGIPIPANWHADIAEWGVALRAIDFADDTFTMIELGCGWGCWMNNTGVAARRSGRKVHVIGVEGDDGHIGFARESLFTNGFQQDEVTLHRGIASANHGVALFPKQDLSGMNWGLEAVFGATPDQRAEAVASGRYDELPMVSLATLAAPHPRIDLLHIDIQGAEADLIDSCLEVLSEKVAYLLIGTHTKVIEGRLFETLAKAGWRLEMERPAIFDISSGAPSVRVDGVQGWRNPKLLPA